MIQQKKFVKLALMRSFVVDSWNNDVNRHDKFAHLPGVLMVHPIAIAAHQFSLLRATKLSLLKRTGGRVEIDTRLTQFVIDSPKPNKVKRPSSDLFIVKSSTF